jgi:hypothetical protein
MFILTISHKALRDFSDIDSLIFILVFIHISIIFPATKCDRKIPANRENSYARIITLRYSLMISTANLAQYQIFRIKHFNVRKYVSEFLYHYFCSL